MGYKEKILELLDGNRLTVKEIAEKLGLIQKYTKKGHDPETARIKGESDVRVYIKRIREYQKGLIRFLYYDNKYKVYTLDKSKIIPLADNIGISDLQDTKDKLVLLMVKAGINSKKYGVHIIENEIDDSIKRLKEADEIG